MDWEVITILAVVFIFTGLLCFSFWILIVESRYLKKRTVRSRLLYMTTSAWHGQEKIALYRDKALENASGFVRFASKLPRFKQVDKLILSSSVDMNPNSFTFISIALGLVGGLAGYIVPKIIPGQEAIAAILFALLPYLVLSHKANSCLKKFIEQFPDALDLLSRALRVGHAFTSGMTIVSEQMDAPISEEFGYVVDEINFGLSLKEALLNMCERKPSDDLRFFTVAVLIQAETGGNISKIMDNLSRILRERIQFKRQVRTLTAEGRVSAYILLALPLVLFAYFYLTNYHYISLLWREQLGQYLLAVGVIAQIIGSIVMKKMVDIDV